MFALVTNFARATKGLLAGIIDCAFENCENGFVGTALPTSPFEFFASAATLKYVGPGKTFPRILFAKHV